MFFKEYRAPYTKLSKYIYDHGISEEKFLELYQEKQVEKIDKITVLYSNYVIELKQTDIDITKSCYSLISEYYIYNEELCHIKERYKPKSVLKFDYSKITAHIYMIHIYMPNNIMLIIYLPDLLVVNINSIITTKKYLKLSYNIIPPINNLHNTSI